MNKKEIKKREENIEAREREVKENSMKLREIYDMCMKMYRRNKEIYSAQEEVRHLDNLYAIELDKRREDLYYKEGKLRKKIKKFRRETKNKTIL